MVIESKFAPGDPVLIGGDIKGRVESLVIHYPCVIQYNISWWCNGDIKTANFDEPEVRER